MKFKRITERTKFTFPCLLAYNWANHQRYGWEARVFTTKLQIQSYSDGYTHWLPLQWPEGK